MDLVVELKVPEVVVELIGCFVTMADCGVFLLAYFSNLEPDDTCFVLTSVGQGHTPNSTLKRAKTTFFYCSSPEKPIMFG